MGWTNFPNGITSMGLQMPANGIPATYGRYYFVDYDNGADGNDGRSMDHAFKTLAAAYAACRTNKNDVICLSAYSNHALTELLTISKNRVHFVGLDGAMGRSYGQGTKVSMGVTTATTDIGSVLNTGTRNSFRNIKFANDNTLAQCLSNFVEGGEYTLFANCEFYKSTLLDGATSNPFTLNGDSSQFYNCTFGSLADADSGDIIHPCVRLAAGVAGAGKVTRDGYFENCNFWKQAGGTTGTFVYAAAATDVERILVFNRCRFIASNLGSTPAQAVKGAATLTVGRILLQDCAGYNVTKMSTTTGVFVAGPAVNASAGIAAQAA